MTHALYSSLHPLVCSSLLLGPVLGTDTKASSLLENDQALFLKGRCQITAGWPFNWGATNTWHSIVCLEWEGGRWEDLWFKNITNCTFSWKICPGIIQTGALCLSVLKYDGILSVLNHPKSLQVKFVFKSTDLLVFFCHSFGICQRTPEGEETNYFLNHL